MDTIVILDSDKKWIANYKRMLASVQFPFDCRFFYQPEDAIAFLTEYPVAVLACEQDMSFMSGKEVFDMADILSPDSVSIVITENKDVAKTLETINGSRVFRLIVKPFFMAEDIEKPLREALEVYHAGKREEQQYEKKKVQLEALQQKLAKLSGKLEEKRRRYDGIFYAASGIVEAALDTACAELSQKESEFAKQACGRMLQEFMGCYLFGQRGWNGYMKYLGQLFHRPQQGCVFQAGSQAGEGVPPEIIDKVGYGMFLVGYLSQQLLEEYQVGAALKGGEDGYVLQMLCRFPQDKDVFRVRSAAARQFLGHLAEKILGSLAERMAAGVNGQGFAIQLVYGIGGNRQ